MPPGGGGEYGPDDPVDPHDGADLVGDLDVATEADRSREGVKNSSSSCGAVPVRCGPVPLTSALWPPRRPHVPPACQYRLALRVAFVPRDPVAMRDAYTWEQGTTGEDRVSRLKFALSERLRFDIWHGNTGR